VWFRFPPPVLDLRPFEGSVTKSFGNNLVTGPALRWANTACCPEGTWTRSRTATAPILKYLLKVRASRSKRCQPIVLYASARLMSFKALLWHPAFADFCDEQVLAEDLRASLQDRWMGRDQAAGVPRPTTLEFARTAGFLYFLRLFKSVGHCAGRQRWV
jgi:hypothetical protein